MMERGKALTLTVVMVFLSSCLSFYAGSANLLPRLSNLVASQEAPRGQAATPNGVDMQKVELIQQYINEKFLWSVDGEKLTEGALKGMVAATEDKYSTYFTPAEFQSFKDHLQPSFSGIGVHVEESKTTGLITVVRPIKGSPGDQAGIKAGDAIVEVDGKDIRGMKLDEAVAKIKGPKGTQVNIKIQREGVGEPISFVITRATIELETTEHKMLTGGIGYIRILEFNADVNKRVSKALAELNAQGMDRLILDLRMNPGGYLDEAVEVSSLFLPAKQPVAYIEPKGSPKETLTSKGTERFPLPLLVLVDENSASAAEIVAGALKDTKTGVLMGEKTFGKGIVQTFYNLPDGAGIKLTTAHYLTAGGNAIHEKGIEPDVEVKQVEKVLPGEPGDVQLQKAIEHIKTLKR
ncbi:MAG: carboxy-terminal processing protease [Symbiobacteriaceae bacterium]|nr:carboxy-terminal processing protease [Symbiobacteriaceae bacterium]